VESPDDAETTENKEKQAQFRFNQTGNEYRRFAAALRLNGR
jgi:hypothetical protein